MMLICHHFVEILSDILLTGITDQGTFNDKFTLQSSFGFNFFRMFSKCCSTYLRYLFIYLLVIAIMDKP